MAGDQGGHRALVGFLYQLLESASDGLRLLSPQSSESENLDVAILVEHLEDLVSISGESIELIQFKHSSVGETISPSDLYEIWFKLRESARLARTSGLGPSGICLHTNRHLSEKAEQVFEASRLGKAHDEFVREEYKDSNGKHFAGRTRNLSKEYGEELKNLTYRFDDRTTLDRRFQDVAREFGILPGPELDSAVARVIRLLLFRIEDPPPRKITALELESEFVGYPSPNRLSSATVKSKISNHLKSAQGFSGFNGTLIPRKAVDQICQLPTSAIIVLVGTGGCGKTIVTLDYLIRRALAPGSPPPFLAFESASQMGDYVLAEYFRDWRNPGADTIQEPIDRTVRRLKALNTSHDCITLVLALDGIDELNSDAVRRPIVEILNYFREEDEYCKKQQVTPSVQLIVTCRDEDELNDWLMTSGMPPNCQLDTIIIGDLEVDEVLRCSPNGFPAPLHRWFDALKSPLFSGEQVNSYNVALAVSQATVDIRMSTALLHPPILGCVRTLDASVIEAALAGSEHGLRKVSERYVKWFVTKAWRRRYRIDRQFCHDSLTAVAKHTRLASEVFDRMRDWQRPIINLAGDATTAYKLFNEALSSGIITKDSAESWRWLHPLCLSSLLENQE